MIKNLVKLYKIKLKQYHIINDALFKRELLSILN